MTPRTDVDPIREAERELEDGTPPGPVVQHWAHHALRDGRLGELRQLLYGFDGATGTDRLLDWLVETADAGGLRPTGTDGG